MDVEVNLMGVILATVAAMLVGSIWYSKSVFGASWMKMVGIDESKMGKEGLKPMIGMLVMAFIASYVLAHVTYLASSFYTDMSYLASALTTAFWVWLGFVAYSTVSSDLFELRPKKLTAINLSGQLVTFLAMAFVIGIIGV